MGVLNNRKIIACVVLAGLALWPVFLQAAEEPESEADKGYGVSEARKVIKMPERWITADHGRFEKLKKEFDSGPEVTRACLSCHNEAGEQIGKTIHWTWICPADPTERMGKAGVTLNNF